MQVNVEIWSDIACPFCYIGKRKFERALGGFAGKENVKIVWKSFQLDPSMQYVAGRNIHQMLAAKKGWSVEQAKEMNARVLQMAQEVGLNYNLDRALPANTFDAHRLTHFAAHKGLQDKMEESLFSAYFVEGKNISDPAVLVELAVKNGLDAFAVENMLQGKDMAQEVTQDIEEAQELGVTGVPFFVFNRKLAVSGAQSEETFLSALEKASQE